jgi:hypothetical protein
MTEPKSPPFILSFGWFEVYRADGAFLGLLTSLQGALDYFGRQPAGRIYRLVHRAAHSQTASWAVTARWTVQCQGLGCWPLFDLVKSFSP